MIFNRPLLSWGPSCLCPLSLTGHVQVLLSLITCLLFLTVALSSPSLWAHLLLSLLNYCKMVCHLTAVPLLHMLNPGHWNCPLSVCHSWGPQPENHQPSEPGSPTGKFFLSREEGFIISVLFFFFFFCIIKFEMYYYRLSTVLFFLSICTCIVSPNAQPEWSDSPGAGMSLRLGGNTLVDLGLPFWQRKQLGRACQPLTSGF